jgi:hypothetical protein
VSGKIVGIRYKADSPGRTAPYPGSPYLPFSRFCTSRRVQGLVLHIAADVAAFAKSISPESDDERDKPRYKDSFIVRPGKALRLDGLARATALVGNTSPQAPSVEFGSGEGSVGDSSGQDRPQGGWNRPMRVLGRAGMAFGDFHE